MAQTSIQGISGVDTNVDINCIEEFSFAPFWIVNGSVYGLLHVPNEFVVCSEISCNPNSLRIPVAQNEMDGYTFQCVGIDYNTNTHHLGRQTELSVITLTSSQVESLNGNKLLLTIHSIHIHIM